MRPSSSGIDRNVSRLRSFSGVCVTIQRYRFTDMYLELRETETLSIFAHCIRSANLLSALVFMGIYPQMGKENRRVVK